MFPPSQLSACASFDRISSLKHVTEYINVAIWIWRVLCGEISNSKFHFFNTYGASQVFFFFLLLAVLVICISQDVMLQFMIRNALAPN